MVSNRRTDREDRVPDVTRKMAALIEALHQTDERLHKMMSMEFWSLARAMDELEPGFWSQYMQNRQQIFEQHMKERQQRQKQKQETSTSATPSASRRQSPFKDRDRDVVQADTETTRERISLFSEALDRELSQMRRYARRW